MKRVPVCGRLAWYVINCTVLKDLLTAVDNLEIDWVQLIPAESLDESTMVFHDRFGVAHESRQSVFSPSCSSSFSSVTAIAAVTKSAGKISCFIRRENLALLNPFLP